MDFFSSFSLSKVMLMTYFRIEKLKSLSGNINVTQERNGTQLQTILLLLLLLFFWAHQHKAAGLKIKLSKIKWLQRRLIP